jgi:Holliday junction resolvasome RuvABC endonuclease subunit
MRLIKFRRRLDELHKAWGITHVGYEEVRAHAGVTAAHCYGALMGILMIWCEERGIPYEAVPVGTLKKFWTGKGNASKGEMIEAARERGFEPASDNEADAIAGWHWLLAADGEVIKEAAE